MAVRARFAPAPSGRKHIGNYRTGLFSWLFARSQGGRFVLRVEDTDKNRADVAHVEGILDMLRWLGLDWDDGPFLQSDRSDLYREAALRLEESGAAYRCWCSEDEVEEMRRVARAEGRPPNYDRRCRFRTEPGTGPSVLRFAVPLEGTTTYRDLVHGEVSVENAVINDLVLVRGDGSPVYLLAVVVDDTEMEISHVIRGDDLMPSTPFQILLTRALGRAEPPEYGHLPLVVGPDRAKLSTRHGPVALEDYRDDGILAEAMVNYMALLGWSHPEGKEIFSLDELRAVFSIDRVGDTPAMFDPVKLDSVNFEWIQRLPLEEIARRALPIFERAGYTDVDEDLLLAALPLAVERIKRLGELPQMLGFLFREPMEDEAAWAKGMKGDQAAALLDGSAEVVSSVEPLDPEALGEGHKAVADRLGVKYKAAFLPPRVAVTGSTVGPPLWESMVLLGREETVRRLRRARQRLTSPG